MKDDILWWFGLDFVSFVLLSVLFIVLGPLHSIRKSICTLHKEEYLKRHLLHRYLLDTLAATGSSENWPRLPKCTIFLLILLRLPLIFRTIQVYFIALSWLDLLAVGFVAVVYHRLIKDKHRAHVTLVAGVLKKLPMHCCQKVCFLYTMFPQHFVWAVLQRNYSPNTSWQSNS